MGSPIAIIGIIAAFLLLGFMCMKGWSIYISAPLAALIIAATSGMNLLGAITNDFLPGTGDYLAQWFGLFMLGALFGKIMEASGAASSIARGVTSLIGANNACIAVIIATSLMTYGGISLFVVVFVMYPFAVGLFKEAEQEYAYLKDSALQAEAMLMLAQSEEAVSNHQKALAYALTAYEKGQDDTVLAACSVMADAFLALGNFAQAKTYYDLYLKARPKDKRILFARGVVQLGLGLDGTAYFDKVKQIDEKYYLAKMSNLDDISQTLNHNKELESDS